MAQAHPDALVLGADTIVVHEGTMLGKPVDAAEAEAMLTRLRGSERVVITGVALIGTFRGDRRTASAGTTVLFRDYSDPKMQAYIAGGSPMDKAGAYGVQDEAFHPAAEVRGCLQNVIGLPVCLVKDLLERAGIQAAPSASYLVPDACSRAGSPLAPR